MTKNDETDARLFAIRANIRQLRETKFLGYSDPDWIAQIIIDMRDLQIENQNHMAKESVCAD